MVRAMTKTNDFVAVAIWSENIWTIPIIDVWTNCHVKLQMWRTYTYFIYLALKTLFQFSISERRLLKVFSLKKTHNYK